MRALSLTFVPNTYCNFGCSYCYLGKLTDKHSKTSDMADQFNKIVNKLKYEEVIVTEVFLHGSELSASPYEDVKNLLEAISAYKEENKDYIKLLNKHKTIRYYIHLKTNLYNLDKFYDLFVKHEVGISGSVDLPLRMHEKYRVLKNGSSTLEKTLEMIKLLVKYPHFKQFSATMTSECLDVDEFLKDLYKIESLGYDMANDFYIMFAYQSKNARALFKMAHDKAMLNFYNTLRERLKGTKYAFAVEHIWFREFLGDYCVSCVNCAKSSRMLIQKNGDTFICHRSQAVKELKAGNIFNQSYESLKANNIANIRIMENNLSLHKDCLECEYFHYCKASCPIERNDTKLGKAYTCALQKAIYKNNPNFYKPNKILAHKAQDEFLRENQTNRHQDKRLPKITYELIQREKSLENIIKKDAILSKIYDRKNFFISINNELKELDFDKDDLFTLYHLSPKDNIKLFIKKDAFYINSKEAIDNFVWMALLGGECQTYGDEQREKIPHIATEYLYWNKLINEAKECEGYFIQDITYFLKANQKNFKKDSKNFIFFTTKAMREYHYEKHAKNAFYHIQAINLPFLRFEFTWEDKKV
ncbi:SPASM domain-containing protein [Campylobacter jejuni]|uniref:radical SAM/SPASM domain-containing protein n=1 Tax=Campylobacter jejuni TaxID=197 RepID=UPI00130A51D1|nr:SPASM domain-containing protein [Campylobacter jejuni]EAI4846064.1 SPASM domain-containing protein [Campylobacter jejuni]EAI6346119.1 SPASM domain-containing protein [Campylobacter jejuni]EAI8595483.1 SPASM domain-containing protein [Campylobacter jejuni]EAI8630689.1 SPASM domain-containing protein [Campylobacter jejuni]ECK7542301.1 SPASM domain-containing protein [Campylobacter jejuni]